MPVKAVILDLDETLVHNNLTQPYDGILEMIDELRTVGLKIAISSDRNGAVFRAQNAGLHYDLFIDKTVVGLHKRRGSREWVTAAYEPFEVNRFETVLLGNSDYDMRAAVNAGVPLFHPYWAVKNHQYGLRMLEPASFSRIIRECFMKEGPWYGDFATTDANGNSATFYTMTDCDGGGNQLLKDRTRWFLKDREDFDGRYMKFGVFLAFHLLGSIFTSGLIEKADVWTIYPGSKGGTNPSLEPFVREAARLFRDDFREDLLERHTHALDSGQTRAQGGQVSFQNQIETMMVNSAYERKIAGKTVVVVDDFATEGNSLECARLLLLRAGAKEVIGVALSKYPMRGRGWSQAVWSYTGDSWDPYAPMTWDASDFQQKVVALSQTTANAELRASYERLFPVRAWHK